MDEDSTRMRFTATGCSLLGGDSIVARIKHECEWRRLKCDVTKSGILFREWTFIIEGNNADVMDIKRIIEQNG